MLCVGYCKLFLDSFDSFFVALELGVRFFPPVRHTFPEGCNPLEACPGCIEEAVLLTAIVHVTFIEL